MPRSRVVPYLVIGPLLLLALSRWLAHDSLLPLVWASSLTPLLYLPAYPVLAWAGFKKRAPLGAASLFIVASHLFWVAPSIVETNPVPAGAPLRVVTANLLAVNPAPERLLAELRAADADVLLLQEVSPRWAAVLEDLEGYPHRVIEVSDDAFGIALLSRRPLRDPRVVDLVGVPMIDAEVEHAGRSVRVLGVHTLPPYSPSYASVWRAQLSALARLAHEEPGPLVIAGDLNSTTHHAGFEAILDAGMADVHETLGRGFVNTWPNGVFPLPPLRLDHVLVSPHFGVRDVRTGRGHGSDHRPVIADLGLRVSSTAGDLLATVQPNRSPSAEARVQFSLRSRRAARGTTSPLPPPCSPRNGAPARAESTARR